jgi:hypothetical protein
MFGVGTLINAAVVMVGGLLGGFGCSRLPQRFQDTFRTALGLGVSFIGLQMALGSVVVSADLAEAGRGSGLPQPVITVVALVAGGTLGELIQLEVNLERLGHWLQAIARSRRSSRQVPDPPHESANGFVFASTLFCVGGMAIVGPIQDAFGHPHVLYIKSLVDGFTAMLLGGPMGFGVAWSSVSILLFQGSITLVAFHLSPLLTETVLSQISTTGGILIFAIGIDLLGLFSLPVGKMIPAVFTAAVLAGIVD